VDREASSGVFATWNIGSLTGNFIKLVGTMIPKRINIMYQRQSKWVREKGKELGPSGFKLWYTGNLRENNSEGIVVDKDWKERLVEVKKLKPNMNLKTIGCI